MVEKLKYVFNQFKHGTEFVAFKELASGHINDTYLVETSQKPFFVLQRINHGVFKDVPGLIRNKVKVSNHIQQKMTHLSEEELKRSVITFAKTNEGSECYKDSEGNFWNMMYYIDNSVTHETVTDNEVAYEGGKLFGAFLNLTSDFDAKELIDVIPRFHDMSFRYGQFDQSMKVASEERLVRAKEYIDIVADLREEMHILQNLKESGEIKLRVTHNDTKISNALFDKNNKGLCVIDTDTVMSGIVHYDFGDAIRTICNTAAEDEKDLNLVEFNTSYYKAYAKGFLEEMGTDLSPIELKYLPLGAKSMIFIMALRFLTDFLNGDVYYKIKYPDHNIDRAKNQFKLLKSLDTRISEVEL